MLLGRIAGGEKRESGFTNGKTDIPDMIRKRTRNGNG